MFFPWVDVEIHWDAKQQLSVKPVQKDHFGIAGRTEYEVDAWFNNTLLSWINATYFLICS